MKAFDEFLLMFHIILGSLSLIVFWIPVFVKKGGDWHVKLGKVYMYLMWGVVLSAAVLSIINFFNDQYIIAGFLGFLTILTAYPLWYAIVIINYKKEIPSHIMTIRRIFNYILLVGGLGLIVWSFILKLKGLSVLLLIFGILGLSGAYSVLFSKKGREQTWISEHIEGMLGTGIAAYTAFLAFGGNHIFTNFLPGYLMVIPWVLPSILGTVGIKYYKRKMKLKY